METIAPMRVKRRPHLAVILSQCRVMRRFRAPNRCPRYRSFCCHCRCRTSLADPSYSRLGVLEAEHPLSSTGSNSVIMWDGGHPNAPHNNTLSDDSDDEYECAAVAVVLWHYYTYMERPPPRPKHTSALTSIMRADYLLDGHNDLIRNCVGALDETHVPCVPPPCNPEVWRNRKGFYSQNVLRVCSLVHDARVVASTTETLEKNFSNPPPGSFILIFAELLK